MEVQKASKQPATEVEYIALWAAVKDFVCAEYLPGVEMRGVNQTLLREMCVFSQPAVS